MPLTVVVGGFYGDEGKGKIVSYVAVNDEVDIGVRGGVGPNAGHTVVYKGTKYKLRQIPAAFVEEKAKLLIGAGVLVDPEVFFRELRETGTEGRTFIDRNCGIISTRHIEMDRSSPHLKKTIATTGTGTGPANADRAHRRLKYAKDIPELVKYTADVPRLLNGVLDEGRRVLLEGTQGTFLSLFHTDAYPYCTSKDVTASAICSDVGVGPTKVDDVLVVFKSYVTRVGRGPLRDEYSRQEAENLGVLEVATVTGRTRRSAPFDYDLAKRAIELNGGTQIAVTKIDITFPDAKGKRRFEELSSGARRFVSTIEDRLGVPVTLLGTGPETEHVIDLRDQKI